MAGREHGTLTATTVATVTITAGSDILVICHGTGPIYGRTDGTAPTVQGDDCFAVPSNGWRIVRSGDRDGTRDVKLISAGTPDFSVESVEDDNNPNVGS